MNGQHSGRIGQMVIYTGKLFRMFVFQNDWKVLPMAAVIAAIVAFVMSDYLFKDMVNTMLGTFAVSSVCIWNGFFNSIQSICRERAVIKREHRSGMHISSYIAANMIYQAFICVSQSVIFMIILNISGVSLPEKGLLFSNINVDMVFIMFLTSYAADMLAMFISSIVRNTTTAMTIMPFVMIFQLVFAGVLFPIPQSVSAVSDFTISKWSLCALCAEGQYNSLPNNTLITAVEGMDAGETAEKADNIDIPGIDEEAGEFDVAAMVGTVKEYIEKPENRASIAKKCGELSYNANYASTADTVGTCYLNITLMIVFFAVMSVISLEFIDRDKR